MIPTQFCKFVEELESIKSIQNQLTIKIDQILRIVSNNALEAIPEPPPDLPTLPLQTKHDFKSLEQKLLLNEDMYCYLVGICMECYESTYQT